MLWWHHVTVNVSKQIFFPLAVFFFIIIRHFFTLGFEAIFLSFEFIWTLFTFIRCDEREKNFASSRTIYFVTRPKAKYCEYGLILHSLWIRQTWRMGPLRNEFILFCQEHRCHGPDGNKWNKELSVGRSLNRLHNVPC